MTRYKSSLEKHEIKRLFATHRRRWNDNIKMDHGQKVREGVGVIHTLGARDL